MKNLRRQFERLSSPLMQQDSDRPQLWSFNSPMDALQLQSDIPFSFPRGGETSFPSPLEGAPPLVSTFFSIMMAMAVGIIAMTFLNIVQNAKQPVIAREAQVLTKRQHVQGSSNRIGDSSQFSSSTSTSYYITFEFANGSREEFLVNGGEWGLLIEGDCGTLHSQGTWFKRFDRQRSLR